MNDQFLLSIWGERNFMSVFDQSDYRFTLHMRKGDIYADMLFRKDFEEDSLSGDLSYLIMTM